MPPPPVLSDVRERARALKPRAFALELTKGCNLRCGYCYYAAREDAYDPSTAMSPGVARQAVDTLISDGPKDQPLHIHFFGGEPLLNFGLLSETVRYAERLCAASGQTMTFEVTTNGTRFSAEIIDFLNEHRIHVGVSFDGPPEVQDIARPAFGQSSYELATEGIRRFLKSRRGTELLAKTHCSIVVTRRDLDLVKITRHVEEMGFPKIIVTPATDLSGQHFGVRDEDLPHLLGSFDELAADYEDRLSRGAAVPVNWFPRLMSRLTSGERKLHYCGGGRDYLGVAADGKVALCYRFYESPKYAMGNLGGGIDRGVTESMLELPLESRTACSQCWARYFCGGGCHHDNAISTGGLGEPNPITCDIFRHSMGRTLEIWARLGRRGKLESRRPKLGSEGFAMPTKTMAFGPDDRPSRLGSCHVRDLGGEKVVYEPTSHEVAVLNPTAAFIFERCDGKTSVTDMLEALTKRYAAPRDVLARDLETTLADLRRKNFVG